MSWTIDPHLILDSINEGVLELDADQRIVHANRAARYLLDFPIDALVGHRFHELLQPNQGDGTPYPEDESPMSLIRDGGAFYLLPDIVWRKDGTAINVDLSAISLNDGEQPARTLVLFHETEEQHAAQRALLAAFHDRDALNKGLEAAHSQLLQSEKLASVGQLAAGVAHEINNPIGFVGSNLETLNQQVTGLLSIIAAYEKVEESLPADAGMLASIKAIKSKVDYDFLREDIPALISESIDGVRRVKKIVENLKNFSRVDSSEWQITNLEEEIESTLNIAWNEIKYKAEVRKEFAGLPPIECMAAQINQVFMNLLVNAAQAIDTRGTITIRTGYNSTEVWVEIEDSGLGIPPEHMNKVFEPFFTTKPVGKGTGLGLSLSFGIIQKHHGRINVCSELNKGSVFRVTLPRHRAVPPDDQKQASSS